MDNAATGLFKASSESPRSSIRSASSTELALAPKSTGDPCDVAVKYKILKSTPTHQRAEPTKRGGWKWGWETHNIMDQAKVQVHGIQSLSAELFTRLGA